MTNGEDIMENGKFSETADIGESRFLRAEEFAQLGHWQYSVKDNVLITSDEMNQIYGYEPRVLPF